MHRKIAEKAGKALAEAVGGHRYRVRIIRPMWGSSGYYSAEALQRSVTDGVWAPGTKVYLDHPGAQEDRDRPERTLRDLVGKLDAPTTMESDGVYAVLSVLPHMRELVSSLTTDGDLDMSIRAYAEAEPGEAEGRRGMLITRITEALSVDLVTEAGAGGRVLELIESARKDPAHEVVEASANDRREQLQTALRDAYVQGDDDYLWVRDHDDARGLAWFEQADHTYQHAYTATDTTVTLTGEPAEVHVTVTYTPLEAPTDHPAAPAGETQPPTPQEAHMATIDDKELTQLRESAARVSTLENERDTATRERDEARDQLAESRKAEAIAKIDAAPLPDPAKDRLRESVTRDPDTDVTAAIKAEADYIAAITPAGRPLGFGESQPVGESRTPKPDRSPWGRPLTKEA